MPRWDGHQPKHKMSPERLAFFRDANKRYRARLRNGAPPMSRIECGKLGGRPKKVEPSTVRTRKRRVQGGKKASNAV